MANPVPVTYNAAASPVAGGRFVSAGNPNLAQITEFPPSVICSIPSVEGYSAYVHPKVLDTGTPGWNGYRYWMSNTNYPGTNDEVENPAIFVSSDGTTWASAGVNPVIPKPADWQAGRVYNNDSHILLYDGVMYLYWRVYHLNTPPRERLMCAHSSDGLTWSEPQMLFGLHEDWDSGLLSPVIEHHAGVFYMWSMRDRTTPTTCVLRTSSHPLGPWSSPATTDLALPASAGSRRLWHMDCVKTNRGWAMLISDRNVNPAWLWLAYSKNGLEWDVRETPVSSGGPSQYRPSIVHTPDGLDCWLTNFSASPRRLERTRIEDNQL